MCVCPSAHVQAGEEKDRTEEEEGITQPLPLPPMSPIPVSHVPPWWTWTWRTWRTCPPCTLSCYTVTHISLLGDIFSLLNIGAQCFYGKEIESFI